MSVPAGRAAQVGRCGVEATPQLVRTAASRVRPQLAWRLARCGPMWRPCEPGGLGLATGLGLRAGCDRELPEAQAEAGIRRGPPVCLDRLAPPGLSRPECQHQP